MSASRISIFGLGYVGSVTAACLAKLGHDVIGVDIDRGKVEQFGGGRPPVMEPGLDELLAEQHGAQRIEATDDPARAVQASDVSLICVGTPSAANGSLDMSYVLRVCEQIGWTLRAKLAEPDAYHVVVVRSTVLPGAVERQVIPRLEETSGGKAGVDFGVVQNPEFLREGSAIDDFFNPPRTVIGASDDRAAGVVSALYETIGAPVFVAGLGVASVVKYADNAFHAAKVTFANEIGRFCRAHDIDSHEVMRIFCEDRKLNISPAYLAPGFAFGGSCLPKDVRALLYSAKRADLELPLLAGMLPSNDAQIDALVQRLMPHRFDGIGILGLSFKHGTDDLRESPLVRVVEMLLGKGATVKIYDPNLRLSELVGANREYILSEIPHIGSLLTETATEAMTPSRAIVVAHRTDAFREAVRGTHADQVVIDLVNLGALDGVPATCEGLYW